MESSESSSGVSQLAKVQLSLCDLTKEENNEMVTGKRNDVAGEIIVPPFFPNNTPGSGVDTSSCPNGPIVTEDKPRCSSFTRKGNPRLRDSRRKYASKIKKDNAIKDDSGSGNPSNPASTGLHSSFRANLNVISSAFMNHGFKKPFQDKLKPSSVKVTSSYNAIKDSQSTSKSFSDVSSSIQKYIKSPYSYKLRQTQTINYDNQLKQSGANVKQPLSPPISTQPFHESTPILSTTYKVN
uniref:Suppressor protein SRP40-like n=1 Tax=Rhabditophanes sp. KR3021 TaxID=114890 RepID=A0AC35U333_9BILA